LANILKLEDLFIAEKQDIDSATEALRRNREELIKSVKKRTAEVVKCMEEIEGELVKEIDILFRKRESDLQKKKTLTDLNIISMKCRGQYIQVVLNQGLLPDITQADTFLPCSEDELSQSLDTDSAVDGCITSIPLVFSSKFTPKLDDIGTLDFMNFNFNSRLLCNCPLNHIISEISPTIDGKKAWILFRHLHNTSCQTHQITGGLYHENSALLSVSRQQAQYIVFRSNGEEVRFAKQPVWHLYGLIKKP
jgi:hypothetical protein